MRRELKQYTRKYLFNTKKGSNGGTEEQKKHKMQETNIKIVDVNATLWAITKYRWIKHANQKTYWQME